MKSLKAWLIALTVAAGMTWMATGLSHNGVDASSDSAVTSGQKSSAARSDAGEEKRRDAMRGMGMMNGMMSGMTSGGSMMEGCPMMNDKRPNDQWQPSSRER